MADLSIQDIIEEMEKKGLIPEDASHDAVTKKLETILPKDRALSDEVIAHVLEVLYAEMEIHSESADSAVDLGNEALARSFSEKTDVVYSIFRAFELLQRARKEGKDISEVLQTEAERREHRLERFYESLPEELREGKKR